ncbi:MAG: SAM-dependent methyltransferase [Oscillospiraceae bacterium]|nr:SAM-dependent methyltransferase [Oscillospiraceae bacterium]
MEMRLSPRLQRIADYVEAGAVAVDVGTDHAYVPIWLLLSGVSERAYATDLRPGPLQNAREDAFRYGVADRLVLRLGDGLAPCAPEECDTVILAGMGGETVAGILERSPWALEKRLILQPQTRQDVLRRWLWEKGVAVQDASLAYDTGRIYLIWLAGRGEGEPETLVDRQLIEKRDPLLLPWLEERIKYTAKLLRGLTQARDPDREAIAAREREKAGLRALADAVCTEWEKERTT